MKLHIGNQKNVNVLVLSHDVAGTDPSWWLVNTKRVEYLKKQFSHVVFRNTKPPGSNKLKWYERVGNWGIGGVIFSLIGTILCAGAGAWMKALYGIVSFAVFSLSVRLFGVPICRLRWKECLQGIEQLLDDENPTIVIASGWSAAAVGEILAQDPGKFNDKVVVLLASEAAVVERVVKNPVSVWGRVPEEVLERVYLVHGDEDEKVVLEEARNLVKGEGNTILPVNFRVKSGDDHYLRKMIFQPPVLDNSVTNSSVESMLFWNDNLKKL